MEKEWFRSWFDSPYYYLLYFHHNEQEACEFIDKLIDFLQPSPASGMLDMGCGKGRHAKYLAEKGFDVTGLDLSPNAIEAAKKWENDHLHFFEHDMRLPYAVNMYDYCFNYFTSFGYFRTQRENENSLRTMAQALKREGKLIIDYLNPVYVSANLVAHNETTIQDIDFDITRKQDENFFYKTIHISDMQTGYSAAFTEQVRKYRLADFEAMLLKQQLQVKNVFGNYNLGAFDEQQSPRIIIIAERNGNT